MFVAAMGEMTRIRGEQCSEKLEGATVHVLIQREFNSRYNEF